MAGKKLPTNVKKLKNTLRPCRENKSGPEYAVVRPEPPAFLCEVAQQEWSRMSEKLYVLGLITEVDVAALVGYCEAFAMVVEITNLLEKRAEEKGVAFKYLSQTTNGNIIQNQLIGTRNTAFKLMKDFMVEFGMTPSSRTKVTAVKQEKKKGFLDD